MGNNIEAMKITDAAIRDGFTLLAISDKFPGEGGKDAHRQLGYWFWCHRHDILRLLRKEAVTDGTDGRQGQ